MRFSLNNNIFQIENYWFGKTSYIVLCNGEVVHINRVGDKQKNTEEFSSFEVFENEIQIKAVPETFNTIFTVKAIKDDSVIKVFEFKNSFFNDLKTQCESILKGRFKIKASRFSKQNLIDFIFELFGLMLTAVFFADGNYALAAMSLLLAMYMFFELELRVPLEKIKN